MNFRIRKNSRSLKTFPTRHPQQDSHPHTASLFKNCLIKQTENSLRHFNNIAEKRHVEEGRFWSFLPETSSSPKPRDNMEDSLKREQASIQILRSQIKTRYQERRQNFSSRIKLQYGSNKCPRADKPTTDEPLHNIRILGLNVQEHLRQMSHGSRWDHAGQRPAESRARLGGGWC